MTQTAAPTSPPSVASCDHDPRCGFATAVALAGTAIGGVDPGQLDGPTLCTESTVRDLLGQLVAILWRIDAIGRGEDATNVRATSDIGDTQWTETWNRATGEVLAVWSEPGVLDRTMVLPFGQLSGAAAIAVYTGEITIRTWDLATATDQRPHWDDGTVAATVMAHRRVLPPTRSPHVPVDPATDDQIARPLIEVLAAWSGQRSPRQLGRSGRAGLQGPAHGLHPVHQLVFGHGQESHA